MHLWRRRWELSLRTRLRRKVRSERLQSRVEALESEVAELKQRLDFVSSREGNVRTYGWHCRIRRYCAGHMPVTSTHPPDGRRGAVLLRG